MIIKLIITYASDGNNVTTSQLKRTDMENLRDRKITDCNSEKKSKTRSEIIHIQATLDKLSKLYL